MNNLLNGNSVILTNVKDLYFTLTLFKEVRKFDVIHVKVNDSTKDVLNSENLIMLKKLCSEHDWTAIFYFDNLIDAKIKKNIDIIFREENLNRICPFRHGFIAVYSEKISKKDTIFRNVINMYQIDDIISTIYDNIIDMLVIDFNDGEDSDKVNYLQKTLVYITKDVDVFDRNFRYKNIKKFSMEGDAQL